MLCLYSGVGFVPLRCIYIYILVYRCIYVAMLNTHHHQQHPYPVLFLLSISPTDFSLAYLLSYLSYPSPSHTVISRFGPNPAQRCLLSRGGSPEKDNTQNFLSLQPPVNHRAWLCCLGRHVHSRGEWLLPGWELGLLHLLVWLCGEKGH